MKPSPSTPADKTAQDILLFLQEEALTRFPAFPEAFGQLCFRPYDGVSASSTTEGQTAIPPHVEGKPSAFLGTDGSSLFYDPALVCNEFLKDPDALRRAFLHLHLHCLCFHILKPKHVNAHLWDMACDISAELLAIRLAPELFADEPSRKLLYMSRLSDMQTFPHTASTKQIFPHFADALSLLPLLQKEEKLRNLAIACARDSHEYWFRDEALTVSDRFAADALKHGNAAENNSARGTCSGNDTKSPPDFETLRHLEELKRKWSLPQVKLENNVSQGTGKRGLSSGSSAENAELVRRNSLNYHSFLRQFTVAREEAILDTDSFDYIPYYFGLTQYTNMPFIEPLEYREVNRLDELAIAIDTSGSCSGKIVRRFLEETWSILRQRENFFARMRLHLIQCDSMIQEHRIFTSVQEWEEALPKLKILGQGNTDFRPVFECLDRMIERKEIHHLRGLLYFTDGDGIFPRTAPAYDTAFVFLNHRLEKHQIPDWALRLNLNLPDEF